MDCLTFRRLKLAVPHDTSPEVIAHVQSCTDCAAFVRQLDAFERDLENVANVAVPEGLAEKIILRQRRPQWFTRSINNYVALAATVVLSVAAVVAYNVAGSRNELAETFAAHVAAESDVLLANATIEPARLERAFSGFGGHIDQPIGEVRFLGQCLIQGVMATHMLVQTPYGSATLILIPAHGAATRWPLRRDGYSVVVLPMPKGSLGIVTDTPEQASKVQSLISKRVRFQS
ncbi:MAG: DUF3379 family protein [Burkholderiales bacterium]